MHLSLVNRQNLKQVLTVLFIFMAIALIATDKDNFTIKNNSGSQIDLQFNLGQWELETKTENGFASQKIKSNAKNMLYIDETETLPVYSAMVAIPDGMDVELLTDVKDMQTVSAFSLQNRDLINAAKGSDDTYPVRQIVVSEPGQFRDFRVVNVNVYPFQYDTRNSDLRVVQSVDISLRFVPASDSYKNPRAGTYSRSFNKLYDALLLNYGNLRDEADQTAQPVLLIIYANVVDATYTDKLAEFVTWKRQKGYIVYTASTAETGTSTTLIKNYITNAYNNWADRPDVVVFIGDASGSFAIPTYIEYLPDWTSYNSEGDYPYSQIAGSDQYGDVQLGRISISSTSDFVAYVAKVMQVDKNLGETDTWLDKMLLVGDPSSSGISTIYTNKHIREMSYTANPQYTYTELYSSITASAINAAITQGVGFYNYRGWLGMSGWSTGNWAFNNANKLNHGVFLTCGTGTFASGTSTTESYVRWGTIENKIGGITAIGLATIGTHTAFNNTLDIAIFDGIYNRDMRTMGEALLFSKCNLQNVYGTAAQNTTTFFNRICNLIGDPTVEVWITTPQSLAVTYPARIIAGTLMTEIIVKNASNVPIAGAAVNLWQTSAGLNTTVYTNQQGIAYVSIPANLSGTLTLTVSKHEFKPTVGSIQITGSGLVYQSSVIDDDNTGGTTGNSNGTINAGEIIDLKLQIKNSSASTISVISATVTCSDPYVTLSTNSLSFSNITAGASGLSTNAVRFTVSPNCPDYHQIVFSSVGNSSVGEWTTIFIHTVRSPDLDYISHTIIGNGFLDIGESTQLYVNIINNGSVSASAVYGELRSLSNYVSVTDPIKYFGNISAGTTYSSSSVPFSLNASVSAITGMTIPMELYLYNSSGYNDTEPFTLTIGNTSITDPLGQDAYGYYIYDIGDIGYMEAPTYNWIGIAPAEGGSGTALSISDTSADSPEGDQNSTIALQVVNLPFTFKFYGQNYNQITVCSNGFIALGVTNNGDFRNGRLPGPAGPNPMIAAFWDDLIFPTGSGIYVFNDSANHRFITEWYLGKNGDNISMEETFQVILYDPAYYVTSTGDGPIKIQYKVFNNVDIGGLTEHGNYSTVGIKDHTGLVGLEYTFNNQYPTAAKPLTNQSALYITTASVPPNQPYLSITQTTLIDTNGNGMAEANETLDIRLTVSNYGSVTASNVTATISESDPWISITSSTASFGNIAGLGSSTNTSGLIVNVLEGFPNNYVATVNAVLNCSGYTFNRTFTITLYKPVLEFGYITISDTSGNNNGSLDPGETATIIMSLNNIGGVASPSGSATLNCSTSGITVNNGLANFSSIAANGSINLNFNITAASWMSVGSEVALVFNAVAGIYSTSKTENITVGIIIENFESGDFNVFPWTFSGNLPWVIDTNAHYAGTYSARSGSITDSQTSTMQTVRILSSGGNISFWYKVSTENNYDYLKFYVDGVQQAQWSGTSDWTQATYALAAGTRTLAWTYYKDGSVSSGSDCVWVDNIIFPPSTSPGGYNPPQNLTASASHQSVRLDWSLPVSGTPTGYKIFKNGTLLTTVTALTYTDLAVTNGTPYSYYLKAVYSGGESDATSTVIATPNAIPPTNLTAVPGNGIVDLSWSGATGREFAGSRDSNERTISGYRVYRNGTPITTTSNLTYQDTGLTNGVTYSYYVTTVYVNPSGESAASNTVQATPTEIVPVTAIIGTGTLMTGHNYVSPINTSYRSVHHQSIYTATELNTAGIVGPCYITHFGFNVNTAPTQSLPNYLIRMKHTSDANMANFQSADNLITVYFNTSYTPVAGGFDLLTLSTPFLWNGTENLVVDTAFDLVGSVDQSGTLQYTSMTYGFRAYVSDVINTANEFTSNFGTTNRRPNIKLTAIPISLSAPEVTIETVTNGVRLSWPAVNGASAYKIYGSDDPNSGFALITSVTGTQYTDTAAQTFKFYRVTATDERIYNSFRQP